MDKKWMIRPAEPGEGERVLQLIRELAAYEKLANEVTATAEDIEKTVLQPGSTTECLLAFVQTSTAGKPLSVGTTVLPNPSFPSPPVEEQKGRPGIGPMHLNYSSSEEANNCAIANQTASAGAQGWEPAGFAVFFRNYSTFQGKYGFYLEDLFVKPEFRGLGIGRGLLETLIQRARTDNCGRVEWSVLDWNQPAIDFYTRVGAKPLKEWVKFRINLG